MATKFCPDRLINLRNELGISKAEASRILGLTKMGYGRYESGERSPSPQIMEIIAQKFNTSVEYLSGNTDDPSYDSVVISKNSNPELFRLVCLLKDSDAMTINRMMFYLEELSKR